MKRKTEQTFQRKSKYTNFVDKTDLKGIQFKAKQNLDFKTYFKPAIHFNIWTSLVLSISRFSKYSLKRKPFVICEVQTTLLNLKEKY